MDSTQYALLAQDAYRDTKVDEAVELAGVRYTVMATANDRLTGFQATAYKREDTKEIVIAYRGTEFDRQPVRDGGVDAGMVLTGINAQAPAANAFTRQVIDDATREAALEGRKPDITVTGHSLGGTLAEINAAKFGLKGETFNAYGAASLYGVPAGGTDVVDHVRAGDLVSAASPHYGQVRVYAAQQDIDTLRRAGYGENEGPLGLRNPIKATDFSAHAMENFVPDNKLLGQSLLAPENEARYRAHQGMVDRYRGDVATIRHGLSAGWEVPKAIGEAGAGALHRAETALGHVRDEVQERLHTLGDHVRDDMKAIGDRVSAIKDRLTHSQGGPRIDDASHPDHALFSQARAGVQGLDQSRGRASDQASDNLAGSLTVAARSQGLTSIDKVVLNGDGSRTYAVQGDANSPAKRLAEVQTAEAVRTPLDQSTAALDASRAPQQPPEQAPRQQGEAPRAPLHGP